MAQTYLFFLPTKLPLAAEDLDASTVLHLQDDVSLRSNLERLLPGLTWDSDTTGKATIDGNWYEVRLPQTPDDTLSIRCSLRVRHDALIQRMCDQLRWIAFDDRPLCFQPHREPMAI